ncbi:uncharacterized protein LOC116120572 [Pistacia vera]|uniref:uncharacterized protein LOC116120572 n=1 Tax=Pistacia vera TaxID=55513 RepID=UPI001262B225|nr:uncharacterized protein LOC116120572 [Pistacia vera]
MGATLSESESEHDDEGDDENVLAFIVNQEDGKSEVSDDIEDTYAEQQEAYDKMCDQWLKAVKKLQSLGNKSLLTGLESVDSGHITYGNGKKGKILGKGSIVLLDFPVLNDVLLVDDFTNLWHEKLDHMNFKDLVRLSKKEVVKELPKLELPKGDVCGPCHQGHIYSSVPTQDSVNTVESPEPKLSANVLSPALGAIATGSAPCKESSTNSSLQNEKIKNKASLVAQGYTQVEGINFDETFTVVAQLESIQLLMFVACYLKIKLFQMDVKSTFLNGMLTREVYVEQSTDFQDPHKPDHVFRLKKALYGSKQASRAWYERLTTFLLEHNYE